MIDMQCYHGWSSSFEDDGNYILQIVLLTKHSENEKDGVAFITDVSCRFGKNHLCLLLSIHPLYEKLFSPLMSLANVFWLIVYKLSLGNSLHLHILP